jgi:hypothetical protein
MPGIDVEKLNETIGKIASAVNRSAAHTERIPEIVKKVEATGDKVVELKTEVRGMGERVTKIESKVDRGHDCYQVDVIAEVKDTQRMNIQKIEQDIQEGIKTRAQLDGIIKTTVATEADVEEIKKSPRRMFYGLIGVIVTIAVGVGGAVWFLAELNKDVEFERAQRTEQIGRIEAQIKTVATRADPSTVHQEIRTLTKAVQVSNGHEEEFNRLCEEMTNYEKRFTRDMLRRRGKRAPTSCLE